MKSKKLATVVLCAAVLGAFSAPARADIFTDWAIKAFTYVLTHNPPCVGMVARVTGC